MSSLALPQWNPEITQAVEAYYTRYYHDTLGLPDWQERVKTRGQEEKVELIHFKRAFQNHQGLSSSPRFLNIGCGTGGMNMVVSLQGWESYGIEPSADALAITHAKARCLDLPQDRFIAGIAEKLPFESNFFDVVYCLSVLEHVQDMNQSLQEMIRVLKPGGTLYLHAPNYATFYEGHYKIFWLPFFPKKWAKRYLNLRGRPADFIDTLNYTTPGRILHMLKTLPIHIKQSRRPLTISQGLRPFFKNVFYTALTLQPAEFWITKLPAQK